MTILLMAIGGVYATVVLWIFYLAVMNLKRNEAQISTTAKVVAYPVFIVGYLLDIAYNLIVGTVLFLELPKQWMFTDRVERHLHYSTWRGKQARWWCRHFLDPFDSDGSHCN